MWEWSIRALPGGAKGNAPSLSPRRKASFATVQPQGHRQRGLRPGSSFVTHFAGRLPCRQGTSVALGSERGRVGVGEGWGWGWGAGCWEGRSTALRDGVALGCSVPGQLVFILWRSCPPPKGACAVDGAERPDWVGGTQLPCGLAASLDLLVELGLARPLDKSESWGLGGRGARSLPTLPLSASPSFFHTSLHSELLAGCRARVTMEPAVYCP